MGHRAQIKSVIPPLQTYAPKGWAKMVENGKDFARTREFNTIGSWIGAVCGVTLITGALLGWLTIGNSNTKDIQTLQAQVVALTLQVGKLADKIDNGPRSDQMKDIDRHLSALDGRMDGMDTRVQADERTLTQVQTQVDIIRNSSDAVLKGRVR